MLRTLSVRAGLDKFIIWAGVKVRRACPFEGKEKRSFPRESSYFNWVAPQLFSFFFISKFS